MEGSATLQLARVAARPGCVRAVGMPDLHAGQHGPIGVALAFADGAHPPFVGGDAGCGARLIGLPAVRSGGLDALERRVREVTEGPAIDADPDALLAAAWTFGPRGLVTLDGVPDALRALAAAEPEDTDAPSGPVPVGDFGASLGTVGGGNHFGEISEVEAVKDRALARAGGLVPGGLVVLAHTGSRGLGKVLADGWPEGPLAGDALGRWLGDLAGAVRYARTNRLLVAWRLLRALGAARLSKVGGGFDVVHNTVVPTTVEGRPAWLHRKGCAPAEGGQLTVVLGSRGARSWVMEGLGCEAALCSVAHGAGRRMTRSEALEKVRARHTRASLVRTPLGGRVICDEPSLLYEEHPDAYKPIEPVVDALEAHGAARRVAALRPLLTVKR
jgi:release factor H-coupled RctB family protein